MEYMLEQFELLLKKYTRLRDELDPKSVRSQIYGEVYNEIIEDTKLGIARAKSRNESAALPLHDVSVSVLPSLLEDLKGFETMGFLPNDVKTGLGIAIEQVERYMRNELEAR